LRFVKGDGPIIDNPLRRKADIDALMTPPPEEALDFTLAAIRQTKAELHGLVPLIGFSGAPFTLASYAIEGGSSRNYLTAKTLMYQQPKVWQTLMAKLATVVGSYLRAQAEAGADALQLFDSWVGALSPADYETYVLPYSQQAIELAQSGPKVPLIHFGTGTAGILPLIKVAGGDVIGVDWRIDLGVASEMLGSEVAVQGNLDPAVLLAPPPEIRQQAARVLDSVKGRPGHIFNLGHGIFKQTPAEHVAILVDFVHDYSAQD
jgi:uroporphyrinogen decarboxylase